MTTFDIGQHSRGVRHVRPPLVAVAMMAPVSLLVLYLWWTTPSVPSPHVITRPARSADEGVVFLTAWMLMTAAMMLPSAMPLLVSLDRIARNQSSRHEIPVFAALAYLGVWGLVGVAAWTTSAAAEAYLLPRASAQVVSGLAGGVSGAGGLVRALTVGARLSTGLPPAIRVPGALLAGRISARWQAARIGAAYGVSCVGCCVPMIGIMFVVGMANIAIVIAMGVVMVIMKTSIVGARVAQVLSIALIAAGVAIGLAWLPLLPHQH